MESYSTIKNVNELEMKELQPSLSDAINSLRNINTQAESLFAQIIAAGFSQHAKHVEQLLQEARDQLEKSDLIKMDIQDIIFKEAPFVKVLYRVKQFHITLDKLLNDTKVGLNNLNIYDRDMLEELLEFKETLIDIYEKETNLFYQWFVENVGQEKAEVFYNQYKKEIASAIPTLEILTNTLLKRFSPSNQQLNEFHRDVIIAENIKRIIYILKENSHPFDASLEKNQDSKNSLLKFSFLNNSNFDFIPDNEHKLQNMVNQLSKIEPEESALDKIIEYLRVQLNKHLIENKNEKLKQTITKALKSVQKFENIEDAYVSKPIDSKSKRHQ